MRNARIVSLLICFLLLDCASALCQGTATIRRDRFGVPHILAESEYAAAFAHGYAAAEDHADLMARLYLRAEGRQAEFFGGEFVEEDVLIRLIFRPEPDGRFSPVFGDSFTLAVEFTDSPTARAVLAYSQSSDLASKHYTDQSEVFARGALRPVWFSEKDIEANLERSYSVGPSAPLTGGAKRPPQKKD